MKMICNISMLLLLTGCAAMPYSANFTCPQNENGICDSVENSYLLASGDSTSAESEESTPPEPPQAEKKDELLQKYRLCIEKKDKKCTDKAVEELNKLFQRTEAFGNRKMQQKLAQTLEHKRLEAMQEAASGITPARTDETLLEVVVLPYTNENGLLLSRRTIWLVVDEGQWVWDKQADQEPVTNIGRAQ